MNDDNKDTELEQEPIGSQNDQDEEPLKPEEAESLQSKEKPEAEVDAAVSESNSELGDAYSEQESEFVDHEEEAVTSVEAAVEYEGDRPIVRELEYQAPRGKAAEDEDEAEVERFDSVAEAKAVVEGFLFSCNEPLTVQKLSRLMSNLHPKTVRGLLLELQWDYDNRHGALQIIEIAGGYQMSTRAFVAPWMFRMHKHKRRSALSPATLETLAIVAYRQPITKGEIETIRGVESGAPLRTLQELNLVETSGRKEVVGRPQLYVTGEPFLKTFGLKSMADLPSISELKSRYADEQKLKPVISEQPVSQEPAESLEATEELSPEVITGKEIVEDEMSEESKVPFDDEQSMDIIGEDDSDLAAEPAEETELENEMLEDDELDEDLDVEDLEK